MRELRKESKELRNESTETRTSVKGRHINDLNNSLQLFITHCSLTITLKDKLATNSKSGRAISSGHNEPPEDVLLILYDRFSAYYGPIFDAFVRFWGNTERLHKV